MVFFHLSPYFEYWYARFRVGRGRRHTQQLSAPVVLPLLCSIIRPVGLAVVPSRLSLGL